MQDLAFKVVGVGSVGTRCLVVLMTDAQDQPLFLQVKQADAVGAGTVCAGRQVRQFSTKASASFAGSA